MTADIGDLAAFDDEDRVGIDKRGQPMRNDDDGAPLGDLAQVLPDDRLAVGIERAGGLVENEQSRIGDERARNGEALLLPARKIGGILLEHRLEATGKPLDEFLGAGNARGRRQSPRCVASGFAAAMLSRTDAAEQEAVLQHDADALPQMDEIDLAAVETVHPDESLLDRIEPLDKAGDRRLARAALADDAEDRAGGNA